MGNFLLIEVFRAPKAWVNQGASLVQTTRLSELSNRAYPASLPFVQKPWLTWVFLVSLVIM